MTPRRGPRQLLPPATSLQETPAGSSWGMVKDKAHIQAEAVGVAVSWLRQESHIDGNDDELCWAQEAQEKLAKIAEHQMVKLQMKSVSWRREYL
jgi:hypothetical protein